MGRFRWTFLMHVATACVLMAIAVACTAEKQAPPATTETKVAEPPASGPGGPGSVWSTTTMNNGWIRFVYPSNVPAPFNRIDLSKYGVQFLPVYPATVDTTGVDTLLPGVQILIMNVQRAGDLSLPINNYVGVGVAEQPVPLATTQFLPVIPPGDGK